VLLDLLHELEADIARRIDECDAAFSEWAFDDRGTPHDRVAFELRVEVVGDEAEMRASGLVEGAGTAIAARLLEHYAVNGQTAWALLTKAERFHVQLVSQLADEDARHMRLTPARTLDEALARVDANAHGYIMPLGARYLPVVE